MKSLIRLLHYLPAVLLVAVIIISCNKNGNKTGSGGTDSTKTVTATTTLVSKPWKYDTSGLDTNNDGKIDQGGDTTVVPNCERDDLYTFNTDNTGLWNTGTQHCTTGEASSTTFTWLLSSDSKTLKASFNPILQEGVTIITLDTAHLTVYRDSTISYAGVNQTFRFVVQLKH